MRTRIAAALAVVLFLVLAGAGVSTAYWSTRDTATSTVQAVSLAANCQPASRLTNGSFETKDYGTGATLTQAPPAEMAPWTTTDTTIEVWGNGVYGVQPQVGKQFVELNANKFGTLYQDVTTTPGQTVQWSLLHRGRDGTDVMRLELGNANTGVMVSQGTMTDGNTAWGRHEGTYTIPAGQTKTRFALVAVSTANGSISIGNFIDDVSFGSGPCLNVTSTVANSTTNNIATTKAGDTLKYTTTVKNAGGSLAMNTALSTTLPAGLALVPNSMYVQGTLRPDATANDQADIDGKTLTARMGLGANGTTGGSVAPDDSLTFVFDAIVQSSAVGGSVSFDIAGSYVDGLAPGWPQSSTAPTLTTNVAAGADIEVTGSNPPTITAGGPAGSTWTFNARNLGTLAASAVTVTVTLPASMTNATVTRPTNANGTGTTACGGTGVIRTCPITGGLAVNASRAIIVTGTAAMFPATIKDGTEVTVSAERTSSTPADPNTSNDSADITAVVVGETVAPNAPTLTASAITATGATLSWTAATDTVGGVAGSGVVGYELYRDGTLIATTTTGRTFVDTTAKSGTRYTYTVKSVDANGNKSIASNTQIVTTLAGSASYQITYTSQNGTVFCLEAATAGNTTTVQTQPCVDGKATQTWRFVTSGTGYNIVLASDLTRTWDLASSSTTDGVQLRVAAINTTTTTLANRGRWTAIPETAVNTYSLQNVYSGDCADVNGQSNTAGTNLQQYACNDTIAQYFAIKNVSQ